MTANDPIDRITVASGVRLAWGCSIHDAADDVLKSAIKDENVRRELAYQITTKARDLFEAKPEVMAVNEVMREDDKKHPKQ